MLPQIAMGVWLLIAAAFFTRLAVRPVTLRLDASEVRRVAIYGVGGVIGEVVTLLLGGFWS